MDNTADMSARRFDSRIGGVVAAALSGVADDEWLRARERIESERASALAGIAARPDAPVYGFTTLLGPLDGHASDELQTETVLSTHVVGRGVVLPTFWERLIHGVKLQQLSNGGSGVSVESYMEALNAFGVERELVFDLRASYGSGDVVPGSWWIKGVFEGTPHSRGDLIALMSGSFISVGAALGSLLRVESLLAEAFAVLIGVGMVHPCVHEPGSNRDLLEVLERLQGAERGQVQLPVSLRDLGASLVPLVRQVELMEESVGGVLGRSSANPLFVSDGDALGARALSQSSFLSLDVRFALEGVMSAVVMLGGLLQRAMESHLALEMGRDTSKVGMVQPAKIVYAYYLEMLSLHSPYGFIGSMSGGVEDLWDGVLLRARQLDEMATLLGLQLSVISDAVGPAQGVDEVWGVLSARFEGLRELSPGFRIPSLPRSRQGASCL